MTPQFVFKPWPNGARFIVRNETLGGRPIIEGKAVIVCHNFDNNYEVHFDGHEPGETYDRLLDGGDMLVETA